MRSFKKVTKCRICQSTNLYQFLDFGQLPIPNGFLKKADLKKPEKLYPLTCLFCQNCALVQLANVVNPDIMFKNYVYIPGVSKVMTNNLASLAYQVSKKLKLKKSSLVVDIGSNDGTLLTFFKKLPARVLGVDPAKNLASVAQLQGIPTQVGLFSKSLAKKIAKNHGQANLITATNVVAHIDNLTELFQGLSILLAKNGLFICEFPYLLDLLTKNQFDTIYHEHLSYFSIKPWQKIVEKFGFEIVNVQRLLIHGGSLRLTHRSLQGKNSQNRAVNYLIELEKQHGLDKTSSYDLFTQRIAGIKNNLLFTLKDLKANGKKIAGIGAAAKGNILTNFFDIGPKILDYIADSTPYKWGLYTPGKHIPIFPEDKLFQNQPDYALILAWNFADEIIRKYQKFAKKGGKFIIPVPEVKII